MCEAGRIKHHLKHNLWRRESTILFVGYQAEGTLGRKILNGAKKVHIFGEEISVNARIEMIDGYSGHADCEGIINWMRNIKQFPKRIFLVHGEEKALYSLAGKVKEEFGVEPVIPSREESFVITAEREVSREFGEKAKERFRYLAIVSLLEDVKEGITDIYEMLLDELREGADDARLNLLQKKLKALQRDMVNLLE